MGPNEILLFSIWILKFLLILKIIFNRSQSLLKWN
jgi:hypothetical protein